MSTPTVPAAPTHRTAKIRPWDYIYLRTCSLATFADENNPGSGTKILGSLVASLKDAKYRHWGLQVRHFVYDVSRANRHVHNADDVVDGPAVYGNPVPVKEWEAKHYKHGEKSITIPIGITFRPDESIDQAGESSDPCQPQKRE